MVNKKPHQKADRPRGVLNERYRRYLLDESDVETRSQAGRDIRAGIRRNLYHSLLDFILIYQYVEQRDIDMSLQDIDGEQRLSRDEAIANAIALFLDLTSGDELADASKFERFVERAAALSWDVRHEPDDDSTVWLGEPKADLTVEFPDRVDTDELADKVNTIWRRTRDLDKHEEIPEGETLGGWLGLDTLSSDEVLYLTSLTSIEAHRKMASLQNTDIDFTPATTTQTDEIDFIPVTTVIQAWYIWQQERIGNLPDDALELVVEMRRVALSDS